MNYDPKQYTQNDLCPGCGHALGQHEFEGCMHSWHYDDSGVATTDGCPCNLTLDCAGRR